MEIKRWLMALAWLLAAGGLQAQTFTEQDFSFNIVDVTTHDTMRIAGTLTLPYGVEGQVPAVILITGSGAQNRDEELMGHKPFKVIAEYLSARGCGATTGVLGNRQAIWSMPPRSTLHRMWSSSWITY